MSTITTSLAADAQTVIETVYHLLQINPETRETACLGVFTNFKAAKDARLTLETAMDKHKLLLQSFKVYESAGEWADAFSKFVLSRPTPPDKAA